MKKKSLGERILALLGKRAVAKDFYEELIELLVEADVSTALAYRLVSELEEAECRQGLKTEADLLSLLKQKVSEFIKGYALPLKEDGLNVILVCGVNGVGKTTTLAKLAYYFQKEYALKNIILCAADTFRAAAIEQLIAWGERLKVRVVHQEQGSDPGAVVFDALESAQARQAELLLVDTSGRMHTKEHLVRELAKINKIIASKLKGAGSYTRLLVIDATTGQNALRQAEVFHSALKLDAVVLAKYDSTAKGGMVLSLGKELNLPFAFVGTGEKADAIEVFRPQLFLEDLFA